MFNFYKDIEKYDVICVDLDNTLFNYTYAHNEALRSTLHLFGFSIADYNAAKIVIKKRYLKANHHKKELYFKIMCEINNLPFYKTLSMFQHYEEKFKEFLLVDKGMKKLLKEAKNNNKKIVAITNFYVLQQIEKLKAAKLHKYIDYLITSEEFETEKPNPLLIDKAIELTKSEKSKIVTIGDSIVDDYEFYGVDYYPYNCSKLLISVTGKSGAGKSTLTNVLKKVWKCQVIEGDGYHKYERDHSEWKNLTHYNPSANNLIQLGLDIKNIFHDLNNISIPIYNHEDGKFKDPENLNLSDLDVVVIDGLHSLYKEVTGQFVKIKIFIDSELADKQKVERDVVERNKESDDVLKSIKSRSDDYNKYIKIQKQYSNIIIDIDKENCAKVTIKNDICFKRSAIKYYYVEIDNSVVFTVDYKELNDLMYNIMSAIKLNRYI